MNIDQLLETVDLIDCSGNVSHTLTLLIDGTVRIDYHRGASAVVDPRTRTVLTPHRIVPQTLIDAACALARG
jgi:hypothetical protein